MFIIFGTHTSHIGQDFRLQGVVCPRCQHSDTFVVTTKGRYAHLFFVPTLPLGKKVTAECKNCYLLVDEVGFTPEMRKSYGEYRFRNPAKTPIWHAVGCLGLLGIAGFFLIFFVVAILAAESPTHDSDRQKPEPVVANHYTELHNDLDQTIFYPPFESDSTSWFIKQCMDEEATDALEKKNYKYFSRSVGDKTLILVKAKDIKNVEKGAQKGIVQIIETCIDQHRGYDSQYLYIGVHDGTEMVLVATPDRRDVAGNHADEELLYPFYEKSAPVDSNENRAVPHEETVKIK